MSTIPTPVINKDGDTEAEATVTPGGELIVAQRTRVAGGIIGVALLPWYVDQSSGGGSIVLSGAAAVVHSGAAAAGRGVFQSRHRAKTVLPQSNHCTVVASLGSLAAGGRYRFGAFDANDGFFFEILGGAARIVTRKAGVDTVVTAPFSGPQPLVVDGARHAYTIRYLITLAYFNQDSELRHTIRSSTVGPLISGGDLPVRIEAENVSAPGTDFVITVANASISRVGHPVQAEGGAPTRVATSTASAQLIASNLLRRKVTIHNESYRRLFLKFGATASQTDYTCVLGPDDVVTIDGMEWAGRIDGILDGGAGFAQVTETTEV